MCGVDKVGTIVLEYRTPWELDLPIYTATESRPCSSRRHFFTWLGLLARDHQLHQVIEVRKVDMIQRELMLVQRHPLSLENSHKEVGHTGPTCFARVLPVIIATVLD